MSIKRKMGLGRGLDNLLPEKPLPEISLGEEGQSFELEIDNIETNPFQPRSQFDNKALEELKESIRVQGVIQPIAVRKVGNGFQLISGERRLKASKLAGLKTIPAYIREATNAQMLELGLIENLQRENLNAMEIAQAYQRLIAECNITQEEVGERVGKDRSTVTNYLRLLTLPKNIQNGLALKEISMGHARALLGLKDQNQVGKLYSEVLKNNLSVRKVEELVKSLNIEEKPLKVAVANKKASVPKYYMEEYQETFGRYFNRKVIVEVDEKNKGEIKIPFISRSEMEEIIEMLKN